jgi:hypothetical protein
LKKGLSENPEQRHDKPAQRLFQDLFQKRLPEKVQHLNLITLSPNPIGVINRRNGFDPTGATVVPKP